MGGKDDSGNSGTGKTGLPQDEQSDEAARSASTCVMCMEAPSDGGATVVAFNVFFYDMFEIIPEIHLCSCSSTSFHSTADQNFHGSRVETLVTATGQKRRTNGDVFLRPRRGG